MNFLKSAFISVYMPLAMMIGGFAGWSLWTTGDYLSWGGVLLVTVPIVMVISWLMMFTNVARTSAHFPQLNGLAVIGVAMAGWGYATGAGSLALTLALVGAAGFAAYNYWYSSFGRSASRHLISGQTLPAFKLKNAKGSLIHSTSLTDKPTIWIFYRGNWCPLCMAQVKELVGQYRQLQELGVRVALVSPQPHKNTVKLARKFNVEFDFLTDESSAASRILGIDIANGLPMGMQVLGYDSDTVMPTVIITDVGGQIIWAHETDNYRVRPDPDVYLEILRQKSVIAKAA
jgi:peroxiredoxin